ncbi:GMP synthase [Streptomyces olivaceoviridis]|uniref:glutamine amidotransferase-related protein n=1 Tax=Streptomyces olivaceoviridis TaxID=1921 RepID=UPI001675D5EA|nr:gamma-glutamyl-gamma-aminobutyrate hydrolase family protein [Streptomyces olivaceoviridis]GGZ22616.1 GMP synthase [Streptomyces olivaceoviridis]
MRTHFVVHEAFEAPGAYEDWARARGHEIGYSRIHEGDALPASVDGIDLLIVMGGPQQPSTTTEEYPYFDAAAEKALIAACIEAGKAVIGVCLGAQLVGEALGAAFDSSPHTEIGAFPVALTLAGRRHPFLAGLGDTFDTGHWHNDMPGLTNDATVLATSAGCPRQIVAYSRYVYGFQCHMEFTPACIDALIEHSEKELAELIDRPYVQQPDQLRASDYTEMNAKLMTFLDRLAADYASR